MRRSELARLAGVPPATIKHYVQIGLLPEPTARPNSRIAYFDRALVDRVRAIKTLQQQRFLPLEQIRAVLGPPTGRGELVKARHLAAIEPALTGPGEEFVTQAQVLASLQVTERELRALADGGLLRPVRRYGAVAYTGPSLELLRVMHAARAAGLGELFTPAVLAPYVDEVRRLIALELDLFRARVASSAARPASPVPDLARLVEPLGERLLVVLRRQLLITAVRSAKVSRGRLPVGRRRR